MLSYSYPHALHCTSQLQLQLQILPCFNDLTLTERSSGKASSYDDVTALLCTQFNSGSSSTIRQCVRAGNAGKDQ